MIRAITSQPVHPIEDYERDLRGDYDAPPKRPLAVPLVLFMALVGLGMTCAAIYHWMTFGG